MKDSKILTYERMWKFMSEKKTLVSSTQNGIEKVKDGNFAFLLESTTNEYARERNCDLIQVGDLLDSKSYGLGLRKDLEWNEEISNAIIMLQEKGVIHKIYEKWWKLIGSLNCNQAKSESDASPMKFENIRGIFYVLGVGLIISCFVFVVENLWKNAKSVPEIATNSDTKLFQEPLISQV